MTEQVDDPVVRAASEVIGGPRGRYAAARELPVGAHGRTAVGPDGRHRRARHPAPRAVPAHRLQGDTQFWSACYADLPTAYRDANVKAGLAAYLQGGDGAPVTGQPPLTGLVLTVVASLGPDVGSLKTRAAWYFALWSVLLTLLLLAIVWLVASSAARPFSAAHVALSPVVVLAGFISADLLGVAALASDQVLHGLLNEVGHQLRRYIAPAELLHHHVARHLLRVRISDVLVAHLGQYALPRTAEAERIAQKSSRDQRNHHGRANKDQKYA